MSMSTPLITCVPPKRLWMLRMRTEANDQPLPSTTT
jgi:hypothetical protein